MTATTIPFRDGALASHDRRMDDDGSGKLAAVNLEAPEQRAALIAALAPLATAAAQETMRVLLAAGATAAGQEAMRVLLAGTLKVQTPTPAGVVAGQVALSASTGANNRLQLPANALVNGIVIKAAATNTAPILIGGATVTTATDGTGAGYPIAPGEAMSFAVANASALYLISSAAGVAYLGGN